MNFARSRCAVLAALSLLALPLLARSPRVHTEDWIRRVNFYHYTRIIVVPIDTSAVQLARGAEKKDAVKKVVAEATDHFLAGLRARSSDNIRNRIQVDATPGKPKGAAVIRTRLRSVDPGSRFQRAWTERSGHTQVIVEGEVLDASNGEVLLRFAYSHESEFAHAEPDDERGGSDYPLLVGDFKMIGGFLGDVLRANEWTW